MATLEAGRSNPPGSQPITSDAGPGATFDDSAADRVKISAGSYQLYLSKTNGAILDIIDRKSGSSLTLGSRNGCLWGASFDGNQFVGGCSYTSAGQPGFTYSWDAASTTLTLRYVWTSSASRQVNATVLVTPGPSTFFDLRLSIQNSYQATLKSAYFPSDLLFGNANSQFAYGAFSLPGIRLNPGFLAGGSYVRLYPSAHAFADYLAVDVAGSHLALYTVNPLPSVTAPVFLGFTSDASRRDVFSSYHAFNIWVESGKTWQSPTIRVDVGQPVPQSAAGYRQDNQINSYPSLIDKLGTDRFNTLIKAPLFKMDSVQSQVRFADWPAVFGGLTAPLLIHYMSFQPGGFDTNDPDFLPADPRWGTTAELASAIRTVQAQGHLVVPYIQPTWWDPRSPTLQNLPPPLSLSDVSVVGEDGKPRLETYNGHSGYVMSPYVPFVQQRVAALMDQFHDQVPSDYVFEDQVGARAVPYDLNPAAPTPVAYEDGWQAHARQYSARSLMTEFGYDRLASSEIAFHGCALDPFLGIDQAVGRGNWTPYPLAEWMMYDNVLLYQHDLYDVDDFMNGNQAVLTFNAAFGMMYSYKWKSPTYDPRTDAGFQFVTALQRSMASRYAAHQLVAFTDVSPGVTDTVFDNMSIIANWDSTNSFTTTGFNIAPQGFLARSNDGNLAAGIFDASFNGAALSPGKHYIVLERTDNRIVVRHPIGADTNLTIDSPGQVQSVTAFDGGGQQLGHVDFSVQGQRVTFAYSQIVNNHPAAYYEIDLGAADFSLAFDNPSVTVVAGSKITTNLTIVRSSGFAGSITITPPAESRPGIRLPADPVATTGNSVSFKIKVKGNAQSGTYPLVFTGSDGTGRTRTATLTLMVVTH